MVPYHVAIIMDGNGRWAKKHNLLRNLGHREGIERVKEIIGAAQELGIKILTIFVFSTENWNRPKQEIDMLMNYLSRFLKTGIKDLNKRDIRLNVLGRDDRIPAHLRKRLIDVVKQTSKNSSFTLNLALDYGGRYEIVNAIKSIVEKARKAKSFSTETINEEYFSEHLYTKDMPEPDLLIRTSGEQRLSNFMLWQVSYTELYFPEKLWPDFRKKDLEEAIEEFSQRRRRFGAIQPGNL